MLHSFVNLDKWNALPKHYQAILQHAGAYANTSCLAKYDVLNPPALRRLLADGAKLHGLLAGDHGSLLQGRPGAARRNREGERRLQEGQRLDDWTTPRTATSGVRSPNSATTPS